MQIGRRIYYELATGSIIFDIGERSSEGSGDTVVPTTQEQDFASYVALADRAPATVGCLQLEYGEYAQDFATCNGYRVDVSSDTPSLLFSYPDPDEPEAPPVYQQPLSVIVQQQEQRLADVELALADIFTGGV